MIDVKNIYGKAFNLDGKKLGKEVVRSYEKKTQEIKNLERGRYISCSEKAKEKPTTPTPTTPTKEEKEKQEDKAQKKISEDKKEEEKKEKGGKNDK